MKGLYFGLAFILLATMIISPLRLLDYSKTPTDNDTPISQLDYFLVKSNFLASLLFYVLKLKVNKIIQSFLRFFLCL